MKWLEKKNNKKKSEDSQGKAQDSTLHSSAVWEDLDASSVLAIDTSALLEDINKSMSEDEEEYDPEVEQYDEKFSIKSHAKEWAETLGHEDTMSLTLLLHNLLAHYLLFPLTKAAMLIGDVVGVSNRTVREWRNQFVINEGCFVDSEQGRYQRYSVLWHNEELNKAARQLYKKNTCTKCKKDLTSISFCKYENESLLMNSILEPGYSRNISV